MPPPYFCIVISTKHHPHPIPTPSLPGPQASSLQPTLKHQTSYINALQIRRRPVPTRTRPDTLPIRLRNQAPVHCRSHPPASRTPHPNPDRLHPPSQPVIHLPPSTQTHHLPPNRPSLSNRLQRIQAPLPPLLLPTLKPINISTKNIST